MTPDSPDIGKLIADQVNALRAKREALVREISEIDTTIHGIATKLGVHVEADPTAALPRLPRPTPDMRVAGSMPEAMMNILLEADRGYSRIELKKILMASPVGQTVKNNENTFYNAVMRYLRKGKIKEVDGLLYHPSRAPLPEGEADPTGEHLPANVTTLFGPNVGGSDGG